MGKFTAIVGLAALAGIGYYVGKKVIEKRNAEEEERAQHVFEDDSEVFVEEEHSTPKEKLQRASMFAVGSIKTGTDKFKEGIDDIINKDMVTLGEETYAKTKEAAIETKDKVVAFAKSTGENIKSGIDNIKNMMTASSDEPADPDAENLADAIAKDVDDIANAEVNIAEEAAKPVEPVVRQVEDEVSEAADEIDSVSTDNYSADSVETFDFSKPEQL
ncbi:MAG: hypothetical protein IJT87_08320 [Ruminiclostridium sp.]|nr:hypothetical protein [Ruminiclostridium sp.]